MVPISFSLIVVNLVYTLIAVPCTLQVRHCLSVLVEIFSVILGLHHLFWFLDPRMALVGVIFVGFWLGPLLHLLICLLKVSWASVHVGKNIRWCHYNFDSGVSLVQWSNTLLCRPKFLYPVGVHVPQLGSLVEQVESCWSQSSPDLIVGWFFYWFEKVSSYLVLVW